MAIKKDKPNVQKTSVPKSKNLSSMFRYIGSVIFLILVVIAFVFVPSVSRGPGTGLDRPIFGYFSGTPITYEPGNYMAKQVESIDDYYSQMGVQQKDALYTFRVWQLAFLRTVVHLGILNDAKINRLSISKDKIDELVMNDPLFLEDGVFSLARYRETSIATISELRKNIEDDSLKMLYVSSLISYRPSQKEKDLVKSAMSTERSFDYILFPFSEFPESEMAAYGASNPDNFHTVNLSRITVSSSISEAEQIRDKIVQKTMSFTDAVKNYSTDAYKDQSGVMGSKLIYEVASDLKKNDEIKTLLALKKGDISQVFETSSAEWTFYQLDENPIAPDFSDRQTIKQVGVYMNGYARTKIEDYFISRAKEFGTIKGSEFSNAALKAGLDVKTAGPFPLNYGNPFSNSQYPIFKAIEIKEVPEMSEIQNSEKFLAELWKTSIGEITSPIIVNNAVIVARVKEQTIATEEELSMIQGLYPGICMENFESTYYDNLRKDTRLKDQFLSTFSSVFKFN